LKAFTGELSLHRGKRKHAATRHNHIKPITHDQKRGAECPSKANPHRGRRKKRGEGFVVTKKEALKA